MSSLFHLTPSHANPTDAVYITLSGDYRLCDEGPEQCSQRYRDDCWCRSPQDLRAGLEAACAEDKLKADVARVLAIILINLLDIFGIREFDVHALYRQSAIRKHSCGVE